MSKPSSAGAKGAAPAHSNHHEEPNQRESSRSTTLKYYEILDTPAEAEFDDFTRLASNICGTPISVISLTDGDRHWFKSKVGLEMSEAPRAQSFCEHTILSLRQIARSVLTALNYRVITAADGTEALVIVAEKRAELSAVITDMHMPNMDGLAFARVLRKMIPQAGIIVASGRLDEREAKEFTTLGISALLEKPFTQQKLVEALKTVFKK